MKMKNGLELFVMIAFGLGLAGCGMDVGTIDMADLDYAAQAAKKVVGGNGSPSGAHFNLNIIGMDQDKTADMSGNNGHRIFVALWGNTKIMLQEGDFQVLDANGTDGRAEFQLPNPDPENDGVTEYSVFARALGQPGGSSTTTTCATDPATGDEYCSIYSMVLVRSKGKSSFTNVSRELLYVYADIDGDGMVERLPLFDETMDEYFWSYDNRGLRLAQLRFYEVPTDVND